MINIKEIIKMIDKITIAVQSIVIPVKLPIKLFIPTYSQEYTQLENSIENINMHGIDFASQSDVIDCYNTNMSVYSYEQMLQNLQLNLECDIAAIFPSNNCDMEEFSAI